MPSLARLLSQLKLLFVRLRVLRDMRRNDGRISVPYQTVMIESTATCNLDCPICPVRRSDNTMERARKQIPVAEFKKIVDITRDITESFCISMWGEPALHKDFLELVAYAAAPGKPVWFSTNLNYSERIAEALAGFPNLHIICSVDGWDEASYADYRWGGRFEVMRRNLGILAQGKGTVYPQCLVPPLPPGDETRLHAQFTAFATEICGTADRIIFKDRRDNIRNAPLGVEPGRCSSLYGGLYFNCDGDVMPCCMNVRRDVFAGNIADYTAETVHNAPDIRNLRRRILEDKNQFPSCRACPGADLQRVIKTRILERLRTPFGPPSPNVDPFV